jgi:hypothetical protein
MRQRLKKLIIGAFTAIILLAGALTSSATAQTFIIKRHRVIVYPPVVYPVYQPVQYPIYQPIQYPVYEPVYYPTNWVVYPVGSDWGWGYREGRDEGKDDAEDGRAMNPTMHNDFYKSGSYTYRQAFIQGYYDGYLRKIRD